MDDNKYIYYIYNTYIKYYTDLLTLENEYYFEKIVRGKTSMDEQTPILSVLSLTPLSTSSILPRHLCAVQRYDRLAGRRSVSSLGRQL
jgi:hypothetical protein